MPQWIFDETPTIARWEVKVKGNRNRIRSDIHIETKRSIIITRVIITSKIEKNKKRKEQQKGKDKRSVPLDPRNERKI